MKNLLDIMKIKPVGVGPVQSVNEMTVVPIVGDGCKSVADPKNLIFERTSTYGSMVFKNQDSKPAIVPTNYMVRGRGAQDHAMAGSGVVQAGSSTTFKNSCCIEQSQGGLLSSQGNDEDVLPVGLRRVLLNYGKRRENDYSKLWNDISEWISGTGVSRGASRAHLRDFYDSKSVQQSLEQFAAEFEPVDGQIGALIMFNGIPVGLEIMPSTDHWDTYWKQLIRGCYGAELIRLKLLGKLKPSALVLPDIPEDADPEQVKTLLEEFALHLQQDVIPLIESIGVTGDKQITKNGNLTTKMITTTNGGGDVIFEGSEPVYVSIVL